MSETEMKTKTGLAIEGGAVAGKEDLCGSGVASEEGEESWVPGTTPQNPDQFDQMVEYMEGSEKKRWQKFANRAVLMARRDGIPEKGSNEFQVHHPIEDDGYIATEKPMVSFRLPNGRACALLEVLFSDDERTRRAMVLNPETGRIDNQGYWFQIIPGDLISLLRAAELYERAFGRAAVRKETSNPEKGLMRAHVKAWRRVQERKCVHIKNQFLKAADVLELDSGVIAKELAFYQKETPTRYWTPKI